MGAARHGTGRARDADQRFHAADQRLDEMPAHEAACPDHHDCRGKACHFSASLPMTCNFGTGTMNSPPEAK